ncbi:hypothetical protein ACFVY0_46095 [Streptomyces sp. NPDC058286]|uniref:hypothetical protein n=1 Tax=Streptomyces sp. NPDC058286 TaxID=3346422 RepID=UPI0036EE08DD
MQFAAVPDLMAARVEALEVGEACTSQVQAVLLFGGADKPPENQPPTGRLELGARKSEARALALRLPEELITPRGELVI